VALIGRVEEAYKKRVTMNAPKIEERVFLLPDEDK